MQKFRKKPVEVEALQWIPTKEGLDAMEAFMGCFAEVWSSCLKIETLEGEMEARPNDWVVKGIQGEFYPVKPDIFEATYEKVEG